ncbi:MAG: integrase [Micropruina sp.]|uniref:integrase n=1 Tax=Micropruina sp. TaxID=2737536 RepID=UPI0039E2AA9B
MSGRHEVTKQFARSYARADKAHKGELLDGLSATTGWTRDHARRAIREAALDLRGSDPRPRKPKPRKYSDDALVVLQEVWRLAGRPAGKYLAAVMDDTLNRLLRFAELDRVAARLSPEVLDEVRAMSAATIDRYLKPYRGDVRPACPDVPNLGQILGPPCHTQVAAETPLTAGFLELKAVAHCGDHLTGDFLWTLIATDPVTGWTQLRTASNESVRDVVAAMDWIADSVPLPLQGMVVATRADDVICRALACWADARAVDLVVGAQDRGDGLSDTEKRRAERSVRQASRVRYRTGTERLLLDQLWELSAARRNHLLPCIKAVGWVVSDAGRKRIYDRPRTPYRRLLEQPGLAPADRALMAEQHAGLNPAQIARHIERLQHELQVQSELHDTAAPDAARPAC